MYIVTGGAGFIGSAFVWKLNQEGIDDILIVDNLGETEKWKNLVNLRFDDYMHKDDFICRLSASSDAMPFGDVTAMIHFGACSSTVERDAEYLMSNNYL
ncbi:MAG: NAD-dependent epimerase/dehydratase family protein, partial [Deltaproteobacteria bacterium]